MSVEDPTTPLAAQVGAQLTAAREASGKSRRAFAAELGVADTTLLALEHGRANPTLRRLEDVAASYGLELTVEARPAREAVSG